MKYEYFNDEELAKYLEMKGMTESARNLRAKSVEEKYIDVDEIEYSNVISEYESLSDKMKKKIKKVIESLNEEKEFKSESDDRDEKDNLDEKDGKENLDEDKKKEVEKIKREKDGAEKEVEDKEKDDESAQEKEDEKEKSNEDETPKKDEYLAKLKKLHKMKIVDYKDQMKTDEVDIDRYYMSMIVLERSLNKQRAAFIKEYGEEELVHLENEDKKEQNKYKRTLVNNMEASLAKLRALDEKLDAILDEMSTLQQYMEDESISIEEYNDRVNTLEKDKLETLWQINKLNPELLEEKQDNLELREKIERRITTSSLEREKRRDMSSLNKARTSGIEYDKKKQDGEAKRENDERDEDFKKAIDLKEERLEEIRKEIKDLDMKKPEDRQRAGLLVEEYYSLLESKTTLEEQPEILEKNMKSGVKNYGDLKESETKREDSIKEFTENNKNIDYTNQTPEFMDQYKDAVVPEPSNPEQAREHMEKMNKIAEEAREEQEKQVDNNEEQKERSRTTKNGGSWS